ncbi:TPA: CRISPR-associated protein Csx16 [Vibrio vulnificus]|nr:CRISPR-associated protein Csx16 [Vibrio vulnificus]HAS6098205.1 CRISPR-associated protein Csx16 [Vibrio vulnificus]HAS6196565.1 CRISPR-associated protein Csx16 [Vibrio vulnificus]HAS6269557.1 CRISPR-associated protein Csx16 [Vibrio vulnificus]HAT7739861.1 CRISPR-associated protein Csx16 [Vibrio vulnificus]
MLVNYLICKYSGAQEWLSQQGIHIDHVVDSIHLIDVSQGDKVYGDVPVSLLRDLSKKQVSYWEIKADIHHSVDPTTVEAEYLKRVDAQLIKTELHIGLSGYFKRCRHYVADRWKRMGHWYRRAERSPRLIWAYTTLSLLFFAWFGDLAGGSHLFEWAIGRSSSTGVLDVWPTLISLTGYVLFSSLLIRAGRGFLPGLRSVKVTKTTKARRVLLLNLSHLPNLSEVNGQFHVSLRNQDQETTYHFQGELLTDLANLNEIEAQGFRWNGTQLLRALAKHIDRVELLVLLSTKDLGSHRNEMGSHHFAPRVKQLLSQYVDHYRCKIVVEPRLLHPQNVGETYDILNEVLSDLIVKEHIRDQDICLDITGGTAAMSCAAAMATIHRNSQFQYVSTDGKGEVYQQDLQLTVSPAKA